MAETTKQSHDTGHNIKIGKKKKKPAMRCTARVFVHVSKRFGLEIGVQMHYLDLHCFLRIE